MKIRTLMILTSLVALVIAVAAIVVLAAATITMNRAVARSEVADGLVQTAFLKLAVRSEYLQYHEDRAAAQWRVLNGRTASLLRRALKEFKDPQTRKKLEALITDTAEVGPLFSQVVENWDSFSQGRIDKQSFTAIENRFVGRLTFKAEDLVTTAIRLSETGTRDVGNAHAVETWSLGFLIGLLGAFVVASTLLTGRTVVKQLAALREGVSIVAGGDLDYRVEVGSGNEIGELARDFNEMAARLKGSYSSLEEEVNERRRAQDEVTSLNEDLRKRAAELETYTEGLESFSYSAAHDLRTPLRGIDGFSRILLEDFSNFLDEEGRSHLRRIRQASQEMAQLLDDLLILGRVTRSEIHEEPVDLSDIAGEVSEALRRREPSRRVEFDIAPNMEVKGDAGLLKDTIENLFSNAWKSTSLNDRARIEFGTTDMPGETVFFVRDNGVGFDMAIADRLFVPFKSLHDKAKFPGSGIGLATVQRIIMRHGGRIWAEGKVGEGSTFYFKL